jgi:hypothetical protein
MNWVVGWIRTHMGGKKGEHPEQAPVDNAEPVHVGHAEKRRLRPPEALRISGEIMQFLTKRDVSLADALEALTMVNLNALGAKYGEMDEFPRFFRQVSAFLQSEERDLAVVALIPKPGMPKVQSRVVPMLERPEGIHHLAIEVGEIMMKCYPKSLADGLNALDSTMLTAIEASCGRERADEFDLLLAGFAAKLVSGGRVQ